MARIKTTEINYDSMNQSEIMDMVCAHMDWESCRASTVESDETCSVYVTGEHGDYLADCFERA